MARPVSRTPRLPGVDDPLIKTVEDLNRALFQDGIENATRLNLAFPLDGTEDFEAPLPLQQVATADLPDEIEWEGGLVYDADTGTLKFSDGANWIEIGDLGDNLDDIAALADPGGDRGLFWDDSESAMAYWAATAPLSFSGATLVVAAASSSAVGVVEKATDAEVRASTADKYLSADLIESASAAVALTDAATVALDWDTGFNFTLTVTANRALGNPTNGQPGTWRTIRVVGNDATDRTLTFGANYVGPDFASLTDIDSTKAYLLSIYCHSTSEFWVGYMPQS